MVISQGNGSRNWLTSNGEGHLIYIVHVVGMDVKV